MIHRSLLLLILFTLSPAYGAQKQFIKSLLDDEWNIPASVEEEYKEGAAQPSLKFENFIKIPPMAAHAITPFLPPSLTAIVVGYLFTAAILTFKSEQMSDDAYSEAGAIYLLSKNSRRHLSLTRLFHTTATPSGNYAALEHSDSTSIMDAVKLIYPKTTSLQQEATELEKNILSSTDMMLIDGFWQSAFPRGLRNMLTAFSKAPCSEVPALYSPSLHSPQDYSFVIVPPGWNAHHVKAYYYNTLVFCNRIMKKSVAEQVTIKHLLISDQEDLFNIEDLEDPRIIKWHNLVQYHIKRFPSEYLQDLSHRKKRSQSR